MYTVGLYLEAIDGLLSVEVGVEKGRKDKDDHTGVVHLQALGLLGVGKAEHQRLGRRLVRRLAQQRKRAMPDHGFLL